MGDSNDKLIKYLSTTINFDCIFFFDEYEKEFKNSSDVLSFMDGTYNSIYRKIFLLTTNELNVDPNLLGRPSRIRYKKSFSNLSEEVTREILNDILKDKTAIEKVIELTHSMNIITIDLIKAIAIIFMEWKLFLILKKPLILSSLNLLICIEKYKSDIVT